MKRRVKSLSCKKDMTSNTSWRFSRTRTATRFTKETFVTRRGRRLACGASLRRTRCQICEAREADRRVGVRCRWLRYGVPPDDVFPRQVRNASWWCVLPGEGWLHDEVDAIDSHEQGVDRQHLSERSSTGNYFPIREGWSRRHRGACLGVAHWTATLSDSLSWSVHGGVSQLQGTPCHGGANIWRHRQSDGEHELMDARISFWQTQPLLGCDVGGDPHLGSSHGTFSQGWHTHVVISDSLVNLILMSCLFGLVASYLN